MYTKGSKKLSLVAESDFDWQTFDTLQRELNEALGDIETELNEIGAYTKSLERRFQKAVNGLNRRMDMLEIATLILAKDKK